MARENSNRVEVDINANTGNAQGAVNTLKTGILGSLGNLGSTVTGIQSAFSLASSLVRGLAAPINEASEANLGLINTTNQFMALSGLGYNESRKALIDLNNEMVELGNTLPGVTDDYATIAVSITDNLIPAVKDLDGTFTTEGLNKYAKELSKNFGFIAATTDATSQEIGLGLNRALTEGVSLATLRQLAAFEKNPALLAQIETISAEMGVAFDKATVAQRVQILTRASEVSAEALEAAGADLSVLISGIQAQLFGSQGIFSFQRLIGGDGSAGNLGTNVVQELGTTLQAILDPSGPFAAIWSLLGEIDFDPMSALRDGIINFRENVLPQIATITEGLVSVFNEGGLGGVTSSILDMMGNLDFTQIGYVIGDMLGKGVNALVQYLATIDILEAFRTIGFNVLQGIGVALISFTVSVDWMGIVSALGGMLLSRVQMVVSGILNGLGNGLQMLANLVINRIQAAISGTIGRVQLAISLIGNALQALSSMFSNIASAVSGVVSRVSGVVDRIRNISIPGTPSMVPNSATGQFPGMLGSMIRESIAMPSNAGLVLANSSELILNRDQQSALVNRLNTNQNSGNYTFNISAIDPMGVSREVEKILNSRARFA